MKSMGEIVPQVVDAVSNIQKAPGTGLALPPRVYPLEPADIQKLENAVSKYFLVSEKPVYGTVPVYDTYGNIYKHEFDVVRYDKQFAQISPPPPQLVEAMSRPAVKSHTLAHLTRLAAHLRDTRGQVLSAVLEDLVGDLQGMSEWAIICACKEFRNKPGQTFFPKTGEIIDSVKNYQAQIDNLVKAHEKNR